MTLERIMQAAINSMIHGHHAPHCYHAHVIGRGYVNDGSKVFDRADYLKQLQRDAQSELESMNYAPGYTEPGYAQPKLGIVFADWNKFPRDFDRVLERAGYAVEWSDEWSTCEDCGKAFRTSPDSYSWLPAYVTIGECSLVCRECVDWDDYVDSELINDADRADTNDIDLASLGFTKWNDERFESGFHPGQNDKPRDIVKRLPAGFDYVFQIDGKGQFDISFSVWLRPQAEE